MHGQPYHQGKKPYTRSDPGSWRPTWTEKPSERSRPTATSFTTKCDHHTETPDSKDNTKPSQAYSNGQEDHGHGFPGVLRPRKHTFTSEPHAPSDSYVHPTGSHLSSRPFAHPTAPVVSHAHSPHIEPNKTKYHMKREFDPATRSYSHPSFTTGFGAKLSETASKLIKSHEPFGKLSARWDAPEELTKSSTFSHPTETRSILPHKMAFSTGSFRRKNVEPSPNPDAAFQPRWIIPSSLSTSSSHPYETGYSSDDDNRHEAEKSWFRAGNDEEPKITQRDAEHPKTSSYSIATSSIEPYEGNGGNSPFPTRSFTGSKGGYTSSGESWWVTKSID